MKLYREEVRPVIDIILDASQSMFFDPRQSQPHRRAVLLRQLSPPSRPEHPPASTSSAVTPTPSSRSMLSPPTIGWIPCKPCSPTHMDAPLALHQIQFRNNAIRVLISDLLFEGDPTHSLRLLNSHQGKPVILAPFLKSEVQPERGRATTNSSMSRPGATTRTASKNQLSAATAKPTPATSHEWHAAARRFNAPLARVCSEHPTTRRPERRSRPVRRPLHLLTGSPEPHSPISQSQFPKSPSTSSSPTCTASGRFWASLPSCLSTFFSAGPGCYL